MKKVFFSVALFVFVTVGMYATTVGNGNVNRSSSEVNLKSGSDVNKTSGPCTMTFYLCPLGNPDPKYAIRQFTIVQDTNSGPDCFKLGTSLYLFYVGIYPQYDVVSSSSFGGK